MPGTGLRAKSLDNVATREWYHKQLADIPNRIDRSLPKQEQALQAFKLRNEIKLQARALMSDRQLAAKLEKEEPLKTLKDIANKAYKNNYVGPKFWDYMETGAVRSNSDVDQILGIVRKDQDYNQRY